MILEDIYVRKIKRRVNPTVVASDFNHTTQEISEYIFTPTVAENMYNFLNTLATQKQGKTGIWINGYYGSGKSHFIKYIFYCLDKKYRETAFDHFKEAVTDFPPLSEVTVGSVAALFKNLDRVHTEQVIFNIDAVSKQDGDDLQRITKILLNKFNDFRGYNDSNIALALFLEKPLQQAGQLEAFKAAVKNDFGEVWDGNQVRFANMRLKPIIETAARFLKDIDVDSLYATINNKQQDYSIVELTAELKEFIDQQDDNYKFIFLLDEVSQYVGDNKELLLNIQTIIEDFGKELDNKVWIACTAQQELQNLVDQFENKTDEFQKIMDRFETRLSLESQDAEEITKRRLLEKKATATDVLNDFYKEHKGDIENQFVTEHDLYPNYKDKDDFLLSYPFIPYQFRLISDVLQSFSKAGLVGANVRNTERAILGITHKTAQDAKDQEIGHFIPFDAFFNHGLDANLSNAARNTRDRAFAISEVRNDKFALRVVKALFMISNLGEVEGRNFLPTIENTALLLMDAVDIKKQELQDKVATILQVLVDKNIIIEQEGKYQFLQDAQITVINQIKEERINQEDIYGIFFDSITTKEIGSLAKLATIPFGDNSFKAIIKTDDKEHSSKGDITICFKLMDSNSLEELATQLPANDLTICLCDWYSKNEHFSKELMTYVRTKKYIDNHISGATGTKLIAIESFKTRNNQRLDELRRTFAKQFLHTPIISNMRVIPATDLQGARSWDRYENMVEYHMQQVYKKHDLAAGFRASEPQLKINAASRQQKTDKDLGPAENAVDQHISLSGQEITFNDLFKKFNKDPYGWKHTTLINILISLAQKEKRRFEWRNEQIDTTKFVEKALNNRERDAVVILSQQEFSQEQLNAFIEAFNNTIFVKTVIPSAAPDLHTAVQSAKEFLKSYLVPIKPLVEDHAGKPYARHLRNFQQELLELMRETTTEAFYEGTLSRKRNLKEYRDIFMRLKEFIADHGDDYETIKTFVDQNRENFNNLAETQQELAEKAQNYFLNEDQPYNDYPVIKKAHKELKKAIKDKQTELRTAIVATYEAHHKTIAAHQEKLGIDEANLIPDPDHILASIKKETSISRLEVYEVKAQDYLNENLKTLTDHKAKQKAEAEGKKYKAPESVSLAAEMEPQTIETAEQLDAYLVELRKRLMVKLAKNEKIYLT